jgi:vacuolar protein-sorting-associated protein 4
MADGNFLEKAIQFVKQARDEDEKENYQEAYRLYLVSLDWFMAAIKCTSYLFSTTNSAGRSI